MIVPSFTFCLREDISDLCSGTDISPNDFLPKRTTNLSSGYDVRCAAKDIVVKPGSMVKIPLGFKVFIPDGWWLEVRPRSSTLLKKNLHALYGVVDEDYENELMFIAQYIPTVDDLKKEDLHISFGERIAQVIPIKRNEMNISSISASEFAALSNKRQGVRKLGGFGSSGDF